LKRVELADFLFILLEKVTGESKNGYFLPLEYYFFDEDEEGNQIDPEELVEKYRVNNVWVIAN